MSYKKKVQLVLRSSDISNLGYSAGGIPIEPIGDVTNTRGFINRWHTSYNFNLSLKSLLGELYNKKGANYILKLENITFGLNSSLSTYSLFENNRSFNVYIGFNGGVNLSSYSSNLSVMNYEALLASIRLPNNAQSYNFQYNNNELSFSIDPGSDLINLSINYKDFLLNSIEPSHTNSTAIAHAQFIFSIYLID